MPSNQQHTVPAGPTCGCGAPSRAKGAKCPPCESQARDQRIRNGR